MALLAVLQVFCTMNWINTHSNWTYLLFSVVLPVEGLIEAVVISRSVLTSVLEVLQVFCTVNWKNTH